jgi:ferredoxin--NADP+ reductase
MVVRSAGYRGVPMEGLPFDSTTGTISVADHRVIRPDGRVGEYACGWIKRGATGVIGTNRSDATATMRSIEADVDALRTRETKPGSALAAAHARGAKPVTLEGWSAIDAAEIALGGERDNPRIKLAHWDELLAAADPTAS